MFVPSFIALSMSSGLATPSWRRLNASFIIGTRSRFTTKPGDSFTSTASFPSFMQTSWISRTVSSEVSEPRITSTSFMTGAGLKKCMPTTRSARFEDLDELHDRRRIEEVHADDAVRALRGGRHFCDAQRGCVRGEHDRRRADPVQLRVEFLLDLHFLEDRFDHELRAIDPFLQRPDSVNLREDSIDFRLGHLAPLHPLLEGLPNAAEAAVDEALLDIPHRHLESGRGTRLGDPRSHGARANHGDLLDVTQLHGFPRFARYGREGERPCAV